MPWCPICKNEYKAGYTVCADCGCKLLDELGEEIVAFFGTEDEIDSIVDYLNSKDIDFAYKRYNNREAHYELLIQENKKEEIRSVMKDYFTKIRKVDISSVDDDQTLPVFDDEEPVTLKRYKKPAERAAEYKAGFQTMLLVGGVGIIALVLIDVGLIPIYFPKESSILINVVMGGMFLAFIGLGINSYKTYKKLLLQTDEDDKTEKDITEWFEKSVTVEMLTSGENKKDSEEMLYFNRYKKLKKMINNQFPGLEASFVEYVTDKLYNETFK